MSKEEEPKPTPETSGDLSGWEEISPGVYARDIPVEQRRASTLTCLKLGIRAGGLATKRILRVTARKLRFLNKR